MKNPRTSLLLGLAFLAGCVASQVTAVRPAAAEGPAVPARAGGAGPRWDYTCFRALNELAGKPELLVAELRRYGEQGWELATVDSTNLYCFKRLAP